MVEDLRVDEDPVRPVIVAGCQSTLRRGLERTAVWVLGDVASLVIDDSLDERRKLLVLSKQGVVVCKLVGCVPEPLRALQEISVFRRRSAKTPSLT